MNIDWVIPSYTINSWSRAKRTCNCIRHTLGGYVGGCSSNIMAISNGAESRVASSPGSLRGRHRKEEPGTNCMRMRVINGFTHNVFTNGRVLAWHNCLRHNNSDAAESNTNGNTSYQIYLPKSVGSRRKMSLPSLLFLIHTNAQSLAPRDDNCSNRLAPWRPVYLHLWCDAGFEQVDEWMIWTRRWVYCLLL